MKKISMFIVSVVTIVGLSGCNSGHEYYDDLTTLFLVDQQNQPVDRVPYICESMANYQYTAPNGEFSFYPGERCEFDFFGFNGTINVDPYYDDVIYIVDDLLDGKENIPYSCDTFSGRTYFDGDFEYGENDECLFYL